MYCFAHFGHSVLILQTSKTATADGSGNISVQLWGEEQVTPSGTYYTATFLNDAGGPVASVPYQFTGPGSFDLSNVVPMGQQVVAAQQPNSAIPQIFSPVSHQFLTGMNSLGVFSSAQPAFTDISGVIGSGQLPNPSATTLGGVNWLAAVSHQFLTSIGTDGLPVAAQPSAADLSYTATAGHVLRGNGTSFVSAVLGASDLSNGVTGSGAVVLAASPTLSGTTNTGNLIVNPSATGSGAALTVGGTSSTTGGMSIFVGGLGSQTERAAVYPADGSTGAFRIGALSVRSISAGFLSGSEVAKISSTGQIISNAGGGGTVSGVFVSATNPAFGLNNTAMAADNRLWDFATDGLGHLLFRSINDAQTVFTNWMQVTRSGASVTSVDFTGATAVQANQFLADGSLSAPSHSFASETNSGWFRQQAGIIGFGIAGSYLQQHTATRIGYARGVVLCWAPSAPNSASNDTNISRVSAGVVGIGSSGGSTAGTIQAAIFQGTSSTAFTVGAVSSAQRIVYSSANSGFEFAFLTSTNAAAGIQITGIDAFENNGRTSATGHAALWPDSSTHMWKANNNGGGTYLIPGMVGSADYSGTGSASGTLVASTLAGVYVIFISQFSAGVQNATTWTLAVGGVTCGAVSVPSGTINITFPGAGMNGGIEFSNIIVVKTTAGSSITWSNSFTGTGQFSTTVNFSMRAAFIGA